ncbi:MAG TPA: AIR synthase-related protein, partial [Candidatus Angelobacter sp.]
DVQEAMTSHFRGTDREILLLSGVETSDATDAEAELGSSEYAKAVLGQIWGFPPALDLQQEAALQRCLRELIQSHQIESAHDCSEGGLAVAIAEAGFAAGIGAQIHLNSNGLFAEAVLFGEDSSRVVITCDSQKIQNIKQVAVKWGLRVEQVGRTVPENLRISIDGHQVVNALVSELRQEWDVALRRALHAEAPEHLVPDVLQKS